MRALSRWFRGAAAVAALAVASRAEAQLTWAATLAPEVAGQTGSGTAHFALDLATNILNVSFNWAGTSGTATVSHIHCCTPAPFTGTAGVAITPVTLPGFPPAPGLHGGSYNSGLSIDLDLPGSTTAGFKTLATSLGLTPVELFIAGANSGVSYLNIHTTTFGGGEIRGFLVATPEPSTYALFATGLVSLGLVARRRRRS